MTKDRIGARPWVVAGPGGIRWIGMAEDEAAAWQIALGWPDAEEIAAARAAGLYATEATVTYKQRLGLNPVATMSEPTNNPLGSDSVAVATHCLGL